MTAASLAVWGALASPAFPLRTALASPSPEPADVVRTPRPELVTPGTIGFLVTFGVAVALVFLVRDMVRRNRGLVVRAERRDAELRARLEADAAAEGDAPAGPGPRPGAGAGRRPGPRTRRGRPPSRDR